MPIDGSPQKDRHRYFSHKKKRCCVAGGPCQRRAALAWPSFLEFPIGYSFWAVFFTDFGFWALLEL
jgi:hypothetical protein